MILKHPDHPLPISEPWHIHNQSFLIYKINFVIVLQKLAKRIKMKSWKGKVHSKSLLNAFYIDFIMLYSASLYYSLWCLLLIHLWHYKIVTILQLPSLSFLNKICCISALKNFSFIVRKAFSSPRKKISAYSILHAC